MARSFGSRGLFAFTSLGVLAIACARVSDPAASLTPAELGERLFTEETFGGNGRTCSTCHLLGRFGSITPDVVQDLRRSDPGGPLFRALDSDSGGGDTYERLLEHATIRVGMALAADPGTGLAVRSCTDPRQDSIVLHRGNPTVYNVSLDGSLMVDGREGFDLELQTRNAVRLHYEPGRDPTPQELAAIAAFQRTLYSNPEIPRSFADGTPLRLPDGVTEQEQRGRAFLDPDRPCGICHSGALRNRTSGLHPTAIGHNFESSLVGQEPGNPNPKYEWCFVDVSSGEVVRGPHGSERLFDRPTADPGAAILPGVKVFATPQDRLDTLTNAQFAAAAGPTFKIPTLWGVADTSPYFHDNSAKTLEDVVAHYNFLFRNRPALARAAGCDPSPADCLDEQERADIVAYLGLLTFNGGGVRSDPPF